MKVEMVGMRIRKYWNDPKKFFSLKAAYIVAFMVHLYGAVNLITNHDDVVIRYDKYDQTYLGRWMFSFFSKLTGLVYQNNWVVVLLSVSLLALAVVLIVDIYQIKSKWAIVLLSGIMMTYPSVASWILYTFNTLCFSFGVLSAVVAVKVLAISFKRKKFAFLYVLASGGFVCMSIACYQAFVCITIAMLYTLIWKLGTKVISNRRYIYIICLSSVSLVWGYLLYTIILKIILMITGIELTTYQGMDKMGHITVTDTINSVIVAYQKFVSLYFSSAFFKYNICILINGLLFFFLLLAVLKKLNYVWNKVGGVEVYGCFYFY